MSTFKDFLFEQEGIIDNRNGWGQVPHNEDVNYFGLRVKMKPSTFLELAQKLPINDTVRKKIDEIKEHIKQGGKIGAPFIDIEVPDEWRGEQEEQPADEDELTRKVRKLKQRTAKARVVGHEGRHRMIAVQELYGDIPIETHLFFTREIRRRHITDEWISKINYSMHSQDGDLVLGPLFEVM